MILKTYNSDNISVTMNLGIDWECKTLSVDVTSYSKNEERITRTFPANQFAEANNVFDNLCRKDEL